MSFTGRWISRLRHAFFVAMIIIIRWWLRWTKFRVFYPPYELRFTRYKLQPRQWRGRPRLKIAVVADVHACEPWMPPARIADMVAKTNAQKPDLILMLGDYTPAVVPYSRRLPDREWAEILGRLQAPMGVYSILGNHDWWDDRQAQLGGSGPISAHLALETAGIPVLHNRSVQVASGIWIAGLGDQRAFRYRNTKGRMQYQGTDDLAGTLAAIPDEDAVILLAHEPDIFPEVPPRVALTLSGHTHGGQIRPLGKPVYVPSRYGTRYAYGHIQETDEPTGKTKHLVVSGGLGCSALPIRWGMPPEVVIIDLG